MKKILTAIALVGGLGVTTVLMAVMLKRLGEDLEVYHKIYNGNERL